MDLALELKQPHTSPDPSFYRKIEVGMVQLLDRAYTVVGSRLVVTGRVPCN